MGPHFTVGVATCGQKVKVPYWSSGCLGVQEGSLGDVTGDFEALDNASTACPVLGRGAGVIELFWARAGSKVLAVGLSFTARFLSGSERVGPQQNSLAPVPSVLLGALRPPDQTDSF